VAKIAGIGDILKNQYDNSKEQDELLNNIINSTKELNKFITSILDLTKIESENLTLNLQSKDVNLIIEDVLDKLVFEANYQKVKLLKNLAPLYPIQLDPTLMVRVISNLVENAIKYSGENATVEVVTYDDADWVFIEVKDNGVGIKPEDINHVFDKFYRVRNDSTHAIKGSGLGLYLVKYFIELHQGYISVNSELGKGTTFVVKLKNV
jgi:signal transduction histidine kinase